MRRPDEVRGAGELVGDARPASCAAAARRGRACRAGRRSGARPATPIATSVVPRRNGRPNESVTITATSTPVSSRSVDRIRRALASESSGSRITRVGLGRVRVVDAGRGADEPVAGLGDHEAARASARRARSRAGSPRAARRSVSGPASSRARRDGSIPSSATTRPSAFETAFCATTTTSPSRKLGRAGDQRAEVVALADLRQPLDREDLDHSRGHARDDDPGVRAVAAVQVHDHRGQPLERAGARERAGVERATGDDLRRERERELLRRRVVAADERVLVRRRRVEVRGRDRVEPRDDGPGDERPGSARRASGRPDRAARRPRENGEVARDREERRRPERRRDRARRSRAPRRPSPRARRGRRRATASLVRRALRRAAPSSAAVALARASSREPITISSSPAATSRAASARPKLPVPPRIATLMRRAAAASSTAWTSRRRASSSVISVLATTRRTPPGSSPPGGASCSSITSASIRPG